MEDISLVDTVLQSVDIYISGFCLHHYIVKKDRQLHDSMKAKSLYYMKILFKNTTTMKRLTQMREIGVRAPVATVLILISLKQVVTIQTAKGAATGVNIISPQR